MTTAMEKLSNVLKHKYREKSAPKHRHILCLYGDDEKLLRITAMELISITVSQLIRLALYKYLPSVEQRSFEWRYIYYYGTKITRRLDLLRINLLEFPAIDTIFHEKWPYRSWWRRPWGRIIQIPYGNEQNAA